MGEVIFGTEKGGEAAEAELGLLNLAVLMQVEAGSGDSRGAEEEPAGVRRDGPLALR